MGKGQVSIEYMLILGFMFMLMIPLIVLYFTTQKDTTDQLVEAQLLHVGNTIRDSAERVYYAGEPSQEQLNLYLPDHIKKVTIANTTIAFLVAGGSGEYELVVGSIAPINGTMLINKGIHIVTIKAVNGTVQVSE